MKAIFFCISLLVCSLMFSQKQGNYQLRRAVCPASFALASGATWGLHETLYHHYGAFQARFPNANPQYWNPNESWRNKYLGGNPELGPAFPGSTTVFVGLTDAKHPISTLHRLSTVGIGVCIVIGEKRPGWHYAVDAGVSALAWGVGFHSVYSWLF